MTPTQVFVPILEVILLAYLIGSIPTGYLIVKLFKKIDIRTVGSGSTGATNVKRVMGTKWFFIVMILDALKGLLAVWLASRYFNLIGDYGELYNLTPAIAGIMVILGHSRSIFLKFTGGKSVATTIGALLALCQPVGWIVLAIWIIITALTKYVSVGSMCAIASSAVLMTAFQQNKFFIYFAAIAAIYIIMRHGDNIKRLMKGEENKLTWEKSKESK
ncbi:glycerol-3-phosphate 1-O-acyltransferase PlsY [bacterium]|nr:glycerol-3-phosphate 1-O-acyltransferase PlsY [bacterium]